MYKGPLAIVVFCFNRPRYLRRLCDSLAQQTEPADSSLIFYQDGAVNPFSGQRHGSPVLQSRVEAVIGQLESAEPFTGTEYLPGITRRMADGNYGVAIQQYTAYEDLKHHFRYVVCLEDDVALSPHFLRVCRLLIPFLEEDNSLFSATPGFTRNLERVPNPEQVPDWLDKVEYGHHPWAGYVLDMHKWNAILPDFLDYFELCRNIDYRQRPHEQIRELHEEKGSPGLPHSSQDAWKDVSLRKCGMKKLRCCVNRGLYIGEFGLHSTPEHYESIGWRHHEPYRHASDATLMKLHLVDGTP